MSITPIDFHLRLSGKELLLQEGPVYYRNNFRSIKKVLVIGGGVTGLTTAWALLDAGYQVTVVADKWASIPDRITSQIAGALWEWPPAVCGQHRNVASLENSKRWCMTAYRAFNELMRILPSEEHGVQMRMANFFFSQPIEDMSGQLSKMNEISSISEIQGFKRDRNIIAAHAVNQDAGVVDSYQHLAPVIDTDQYMGWLRNTVAMKGARFITKQINGDLLEQENKLRLEYGVDAIVNATALGAAELAADPNVYPLRGALIRVVNDGSRFPVVKEALCVSHNNTLADDMEDIVFVVPRNDKVLILGGLAQPDVHALDLTLDSPEIVRMRKRCNDFVPGLANAEYDETPFVQGLRPLTDENVRVERERRWKINGTTSRVIHSYGHGGSGFTLSFGCAADVLGLLKGLDVEIAASGEVKSHL